MMTRRGAATGEITGIHDPTEESKDPMEEVFCKYCWTVTPWRVNLGDNETCPKCHHSVNEVREGASYEGGDPPVAKPC